MVGDLKGALVIDQSTFTGNSNGERGVELPPEHLRAGHGLGWQRRRDHHRHQVRLKRAH
jgi:hypothetical protein